jgi:hypothetical protein
MATALIPTAAPVALRENTTARGAHWRQLNDAVRRRAGRIEGILLAVAMLVPQLIVGLLGGD